MPTTENISIRVTTPRGVSLYVTTLDDADLLAEFGGPGTEIFYIPAGSTGGWRVWTEGREWDDADDFRYHLFALYVKRTRRLRKQG